MRKLKKFFKFLPAMCLALISGLSVVLFDDHKLNPTYADADYLVSQRSVNNVDYHYSNSSGVSFSFTYNFTFYLYRSASNGTYYYTIDVYFRERLWSTSYNGITYNASTLENTPPDNFSLTFVSSPFYINSNNPLINISIANTGTNTSYNRLTQYNNIRYWFYSFFHNINFSSDSFDSFNVRIPTADYAYIAYKFGNDVISAYDSSSIINNTTFALLSYRVDTTQSNYDLGYADGYSVGRDEGYNNGYADGYNTGTDLGYADGFNAGVESQQTAIDEAYDNGYSAGYDDGFNVDSVTGTIFSGILQIGMLPVNVLLAIFNFEILGINIAGFVSAILTVCLTIIVIRTVTGKKE